MSGILKVEDVCQFLAEQVPGLCSVLAEAFGVTAPVLMTKLEAGEITKLDTIQKIAAMYIQSRLEVLEWEYACGAPSTTNMEDCRKELEQFIKRHKIGEQPCASE